MSNLTNVITKNDGISIFAVSKQSKIIKNIIRNILEGDTAVKGVILVQDDNRNIQDLIKAGKEIDSKHSVLMIQSGTEVKSVSFDEANKKAMRRLPDLTLISDLYEDNAIKAAVESAMSGNKIIGESKAASIEEIVPNLIRLMPIHDQNMMAYDLINSLNVIVFEDNDTLTSLVFDEALKEELSDIIRTQGFDTKALKEGISKAVRLLAG